METRILSPEVLARKLERLALYLGALEGHRGRSAVEIRDDPYELERLLVLLVQVAVDIAAHLVVEQGAAPSSYREAFLEAGRQRLIPEALAAKIADAAGLRNILVHLYEEIDYEIVANSVPNALQDFREFLQAMEKRLDG